MVQTFQNFRFFIEPVGDVTLGVGLVQLLDGPWRSDHPHSRRSLEQKNFDSWKVKQIRKPQLANVVCTC